MNLLILKTDIATEQRLQAIRPIFDIHVSIKDWSVDINDVDNVLRVVAKDNLNGQNAAFFFGGILGTVILTDSLKVLLAKAIRRWLKPKHILWTRRISGIALVVFGVVLMVRVVI